MLLENKNTNKASYNLHKTPFTRSQILFFKILCLEGVLTKLKQVFTLYEDRLFLIYKDIESRRGPPVSFLVIIVNKR